MSDPIPRTVHRDLQFENGQAIGTSNRWEKGQYCSVLTPAGIVGCGIYDLEVAAEFDLAIAIAKGTPASPLVEPEDLYDARIVGLTPKAGSYGIRVGMTGREAVERMLRAGKGATERLAPTAGRAVGVKHIDHVTLVVKDLEESRRFYVEVLGMKEIRRPAFSFAGLWFQAGATQIHLIGEFSGSGPAGNLLPEHIRSSRTQHVAFEVEDAEAAEHRLKEMGVSLLAGTKKRPDGILQMYVCDPDGHVIELCSPAKEPAATPPHPPR
jgi:catechol 2,3-dioxygenase-like lactoylglutathione lyase family enzyme